MAQNPLNNSALSTFTVPRDVYNAIRNAAAKTGVNFTYLMEKAAAESSFDANAKAKTSSATGLFQFIESTWLKMVKNHGEKYGLSAYADKINDDGKVSDSKTRKEILNLRKDPEIASYMAAEFASDNYDYLKAHVGGQIDSTELYLAHFLGAGGAAGFLNAMKKSPNMTAADLFPKEARSNRNVFYDAKSGAPRSLREIYAYFDKKFDGGKIVDQPQTIMTAANDDRTQSLMAVQKSPTAIVYENDPFAKLASLLATRPASSDSLLRIAHSGEQTAQNNWQMMPANLYGNLSLSTAQMMLLNDFTA